LLGSHPVIVVGNLVNNLISPIEMLDHAGTMVLDRGGGEIRNAEGTSAIPIR
jgi:hypothetical protein